ncbi:MAG: hypothetical protein JWN08_2968, partial [Frankiales bacterium]|nr:hypothetical protein [Frankiales bacterium]
MAKSTNGRGGAAVPGRTTGAAPLATPSADAARGLGKRVV